MTTPVPQPPVPRVWSRTTRLVVAAGTVLIVTAAVAAVVVLTTAEEVPTARPDAASAFGDDAVLDDRVVAVEFSPSGRLVLVQTQHGIGVATGEEGRPDGEVALLTPRGSRAVDAAWFPSETAVLIAEGPIPTGQLAVVSLDGTVLGVVELSPSFGVGTGHGMAVAPDGRRAVVTAEERAPIGGERHLHLVLVDLETGVVTDATAPDGAHSSEPAFLSDERVVYTETAREPDGGSRTMVLDLTSGTTEPVSPRGADARAAGVVNGRPAYVTGDAVWIAASDGDGEPRRLATVGGDLLAVHPEGRLLVVGRRGRAEMVDLRG